MLLIDTPTGMNDTILTGMNDTIRYDVIDHYVIFMALSEGEERIRSMHLL